jgi:hypothetical protein
MKREIKNVLNLCSFIKRTRTGFGIFEDGNHNRRQLFFTRLLTVVVIFALTVSRL